MTGTLPAGMPDALNARLPASYENARQALAECSQIDECQEWANKAEALASYAKQADDDTLRRMADRIQARAVRRAQELLKQYPERVGRNEHSVREGDHTNQTRRQVANDAGMSNWQYRTAMDVGHVPDDQFEEQVESDQPPTVTKLAEQGRQHRNPDIPDHLQGRDSQDYYNATHAVGALGRMVAAADKYPPDSVARGLSDKEKENVRIHVAKVDAWLDTLITQI